MNNSFDGNIPNYSTLLKYASDAELIEILMRDKRKCRITHGAWILFVLLSQCLIFHQAALDGRCSTIAFSIVMFIVSIVSGWCIWLDYQERASNINIGITRLNRPFEKINQILAGGPPYAQIIKQRCGKYIIMVRHNHEGSSAVLYCDTVHNAILDINNLYQYEVFNNGT